MSDNASRPAGHVLPKDGQVVTYHGSVEECHGARIYAGHCTCPRCFMDVLSGQPARYLLHPIAESLSPPLYHVRHESFTVAADHA
ncbi:hypothetical protein [Embleya sp. NBC_00896]|uniref:hypothetical protein n=1 Tax=Embleya sp. NBC_00896 TaxID=2975961 RepID=UPI002F90A2AB|nr:hypothetical protein OG928_48655 [Embleya sp. NBC_00896]